MIIVENQSEVSDVVVKKNQKNPKKPNLNVELEIEKEQNVENIKS